MGRCQGSLNPEILKLADEFAAISILEQMKGYLAYVLPRLDMSEAEDKAQMMRILGTVFEMEKGSKSSDLYKAAFKRVLSLDTESILSNREMMHDTPYADVVDAKMRGYGRLSCRLYDHNLPSNIQTQLAVLCAFCCCRNKSSSACFKCGLWICSECKGNERYRYCIGACDMCHKPRDPRRNDSCICGLIE